MTQLLRYYIRMGHTRKSNCALTPRTAMLKVGQFRHIHLIEITHTSVNESVVPRCRQRRKVESK